MRQAILLQDIFDFRAVIDPLLQPILASYVRDSWVTYEKALWWVICEEIWDCHLLTEPRHTKMHPYPQIHDRLKNAFHELYPCWDFSWFFAQLVKAPRVYIDCAQVHVDVRGRDLFITYQTHEMLALPFNAT
jgi:hypothetical protein